MRPIHQEANRQQSISYLETQPQSIASLPHTTLVLPPEVRLSERLAERAVHDYIAQPSD